MSSFKDLRVVDNFYQTSLFFPMPTVLVSTLTEDGKTTVGPYSLVQPYYVAGKEYYAMLLNARNSSNTAQNILRNGKCAINFVTDDRKTFKAEFFVDYVRAYQFKEFIGDCKTQRKMLSPPQAARAIQTKLSGGSKMKIEILKTKKRLDVILEGKLDAVTSPELEEKLMPALNDIQTLIFDFSKLTMISSAGLRVLLTAIKRMDDLGGTMTIKNASDDVKKVFKLTGFIDVMNVQ